jgi:Mrp family chromosome partitioning ATPase
MNRHSLEREVSHFPLFSLAGDSLAYKIFPPVGSGSNSIAIAFTSANTGEGVTHVTGSVVQAIEAICPGRAVYTSVESLKAQQMQKLVRTASDRGERFNTSSGWENLKVSMQQLRSQAQFVAIDCPAIATSSDALSLARLVEGMVLVVEADRTKKVQIRNAERQIAAAGGNLLGLVLNKRRYPIPGAIYRLL